ncbi:esterase FE4-like [Hylaeus volcanicus]|uniref:esterase FE4-like n=1 Tax=Hylaeus volcanicus TaxID=313075 RepID=UPI0023B7A0FC|nr:esterase FE4-like [Hylaeus volcanicus]XP_053994651.1 esterase FE4-like [Hylaeus volcanicus]
MYKPIVTLKQGKARGASVQGVLGSSYIAFHEIPFAAPPVGELRFKDPEPPVPWTGIRNCTTATGKFCAQAEDATPDYVFGSEDCLYLNVYTNSLNQSKPVIFWIHGGSFKSGAGSFKIIRPDYLITKDVVVVTVTYRLGAFGFLNLGHRVAPGNQGLKDLIAALEWVKENIAKFGGDPNNVTIAGQSAGGVLVHALTVSPRAKGLFHKAIMQSGLLTCSWGFGQSHPERGFKLAAALGINSNDPEEIVKEMRKLSDKDIVLGYPSILTRHESQIYEMAFGVNYDDIAENPVLPLHIDELSSNDASIPVLTGYLSYDCIMFFNDNGKEAVDNYNRYLPDYVKILGRHKHLGSAKLEELMEFVKDHYFNGQPISSNMMEQFLRFVTDIYFTVPMRKYIEDRVKRTSAPTYLYKFSYVGNEMTFTDLSMKRVVRGSSHMDELAYILYSPLCKIKSLEPPPVGTKDRDLIEFLCTTWSNFARTGHCTPCQDGVIKTTWNPVTKEERCYLEIGERIELLPYKPDAFNSIYTLLADL